MCEVGEYLDYENCKCRKTLVDKLVDECTRTVEEVKIAKITLPENEMYFLHSLYYVGDSSFHNLYQNWYLFCLLQLVFG